MKDGKPTRGKVCACKRLEYERVDPERKSKVGACSWADGMDCDSERCSSRGKAGKLPTMGTAWYVQTSPLKIRSLPGLWISSDHSTCCNTSTALCCFVSFWGVMIISLLFRKTEQHTEAFFYWPYIILATLCDFGRYVMRFLEFCHQFPGEPAAHCIPSSLFPINM